MIVLDTGVIIANANKRDQHHQACMKLLLTSREPLTIPEVLLTEIGYMLLTRTGPVGETAFMEDVADGLYEIVSFDGADFRRVAELMSQYIGFPLGTADASVIAAAEKLKSSKIATLDRRHFMAVQPRHIPAFTLLP